MTHSTAKRISRAIALSIIAIACTTAGLLKGEIAVMWLGGVAFGALVASER